MSKEQKTRKNEKKKPLTSAKEKKAEKREKKSQYGYTLYAQVKNVQRILNV